MSFNKTILITGPSGSGKSHLCSYLSGIGIPVADTDSIPNLAIWVDENGTSVPYPENATEQWLSVHRFIWKREVLAVYLHGKRPMVLVGLSHDDANDFKDLFDHIIYLKTPAHTLEQRLANRNNNHGRTEEQRKSVLNDVADFDAKAERNGYLIIDGEKSPEEIWRDIQKL